MSAASTANTPKVLAIDVGGTHVKVLATGQREFREIPSGAHDDRPDDGHAG